MTKTRQLYFFIALLFSLFFTSTQASEKEAWEALQQGKAVALMRHAYAPPTNEISPISPKKCEGERNLSAQGAQQAKDIAKTFRSNKIHEADVYSSTLCRCIDTGVLFEYGEVKNLPELNSFAKDRSVEAEQTEALKEWIKTSIKETNTPQILVSHGFNINGLMGGFADQGDVLIVGLKDDKLVNLHQFSTSFF